MSLLLPTDDNGNAFAILGYAYRGTQRLTVGTTSIRNATALSPLADVVTIIATGYCRFEIGDATVTADPNLSPILFPGQYLDIPLRRTDRFVAFVATDPCDAYIMTRT